MVGIFQRSIAIAANSHSVAPVVAGVTMVVVAVADAVMSVRMPKLRPIGAAVIPWPTAVVVRPIAIELERDDRNVDDRYVVRQIDVPVAVKIFEIDCTYPTAIVVPRHVTPIVSGQAPMNGQASVIWDSGDDWVLGTRPSAEVNVRCRVATSR
jgi:hypothetical protein